MEIDGLENKIYKIFIRNGDDNIEKEKFDSIFKKYVTITDNDREIIDHYILFRKLERKISDLREQCIKDKYQKPEATEFLIEACYDYLELQPEINEYSKKILNNLKKPWYPPLFFNSDIQKYLAITLEKVGRNDEALNVCLRLQQSGYSDFDGELQKRIDRLTKKVK